MLSPTSTVRRLQGRVRALGARSKVGMAPGAVVFTGDDVPTEPVSYSVWHYDADDLRVTESPTLDDALSARDAAPISWVNVYGVHDADVIRRIGDHYGLHPLVQEDIAHVGQRPKVEVYDDHVYVVLKMLYLADAPSGHTNGTPSSQKDASPAVVYEQLSIVLTGNTVLAFQERSGDIFDPVRQRIRGGRGRIRTSGADYLTYALLDVVVDHYFVVLEHLGAQTEDLEDAALGEATPETLQAINDLRRKLVSIRRLTWPVRELLAQIDRADTPLWDDATRPFLRDVYDHAVQVLDLVESLRDVVGGLTDLYLTTVSNRMNEIMKVLTIIGTIFLPLTFIVGVYGMNFEYMPELGVSWAYFAIWAVMIALAIGLLGYFRSRDWL